MPQVAKRTGSATTAKLLPDQPQAHAVAGAPGRARVSYFDQLVNFAGREQQRDRYVHADLTSATGYHDCLFGVHS